METPCDNTEVIDDPQWFIFTNDGKGSVVTAPTIQKAVSNFKKDKRNSRRGEVVGVIAALQSVTHPSQIQSTYVYGVICCMGKSDHK
jgi:hypothetical protein